MALHSFACLKLTAERFAALCCCPVIHTVGYLCSLAVFCVHYYVKGMHPTPFIFVHYMCIITDFDSLVLADCVPKGDGVGRVGIPGM